MLEDMKPKVEDVMPKLEDNDEEDLNADFQISQLPSWATEPFELARETFRDAMLGRMKKYSQRQVGPSSTCNFGSPPPITNWSSR